MRDCVTRARLGMNLQYCAEAGWYWIFDDVTLGIVTTGLEPSLFHYNISFIGLLWADISYSSSDLPPYSMILEEEWAQLSSLARETMNQNSSSSTIIDCWRQSTDGSCWNWSEDTPGDKTQWLARGNFMRLNYIVISGSTIRNRTVHSLLTSRQRFHCHDDLSTSIKQFSYLLPVEHLLWTRTVSIIQKTILLPSDFPQTQLILMTRKQALLLPLSRET